MNNTENVYCRLCAELKPHNELANLHTDEETCQKVVNKLTRFNIAMDFQQTKLPKTVCSLCVNKLEQAFAFVIAVEQAQEFLSDFVLEHITTAESDSCDEFTLHEPSDVGKDVIKIIKVESKGDSMDVGDFHEASLGDECDIHNDVGIGDTEEVHNEKKDDITHYDFADENINTKDESDECTNINSPKDKSLDFSNDCLEKYTNATEKDFEIQDSNITHFKLEEKVIKDIENNTKPNLQLENSAYSEDNNSTVGTRIPRKRKQCIVKTSPPKPLDTTVYSEDYITKQINRLSTVPVQCLKKTWMDYEWKCSHCGTLFPHVEELQKHSMIYHNICNAYQCTECKIKKSRLNAFMKHVRYHRKYLHYSCYKCFEKFPKMMETRHHKTSHENSKYVCLGCNTPFSNNSELEEHVKKYYNILCKRKIFISRDNLTCSACNKVCATVHALRCHLHYHLNKDKEKKKDRVCDRCGKCFQTEQKLRIHMDLHTKKVLYHCEICKTTFKSACSLRSHASIHSGIKPFTCDTCKKCFRTKGQLRNHMKFHSDYFLSCSVCNNKYHTESNLQRHMLQHTGEKPYSCDICQRDFTNISNRNKHMRRRHDIEMAKKRQPIIIKQQTVDDPTAPNLFSVEAKSGDVDKMDEWENKVTGQVRRQTARLKKREC